MTNYAVTILPGGNDSGAAVTASADMSPRDATALAGATTFAPDLEIMAACRLHTPPSRRRSVPFRSVQSVNA
jgi:hypothetical protein